VPETRLAFRRVHRSKTIDVDRDVWVFFYRPRVEVDGGKK